MGYLGSLFSRFGVLRLVAGTLLFASLGCLRAQGPSAVTEADVIDLQLHHYFTPDKKAHDPDFEWTFTKEEFVLKKGKGPIPADLLEKLLPPKTIADEIHVKWRLEKDGRQLTLSEITAGDKAGKKDVALHIYKTGGIVVRIGEPQYVFSIGK